MNRLCLAALAALMLAALSAPAWSQNAVANGQKFRGSVVPVYIGGTDVRGGADSVGYSLRVDSDGSAHIKRDDLPEARNNRTTLISAIVAKNGGVFTSNFPVPVKGVKYITVQLLMTPGTVAADTDSVNVEVYPLVKQTDQPTDGINETWDLDQTDAYMTPLYFTRNQNPVVAPASNTNWGRRVFCGRQAGQAAIGAGFNTCAAAALVDDSGAPVQGEYISVRVVNRNVNRDISLQLDLYLHYE